MGKASLEKKAEINLALKLSYKLLGTEAEIKVEDVPMEFMKLSSLCHKMELG